MSDDCFWHWMTYDEVKRLDKRLSSVVYAIKCVHNDKMYVGKTCGSYVNRMYMHQRSLHHASETQPFYNALKKHGLASFRFMILEQVHSHSDLLQRESWYIALFGTYVHNDCDAGYNMTLGGDGTSGIRHSDTSRALIAQKHRGKSLSDDHKRAISQANRGRRFTVEHRSRIGLAHRGKTWTEQQRRSFQHTRTGVSNKKCNKPVEQIDLQTGDIIALFSSVKEAKRSTGIAHVDTVCRGIRRQAGGFGWRYVQSRVLCEAQSVLDQQSSTLCLYTYGCWYCHADCGLRPNDPLSQTCRCSIFDPLTSWRT